MAVRGVENEASKMAVDAAYIAQFKQDLINLPAEEVYARYITTPECMGLSEVDQAALRATIADRFHVHPNSVVIVGSAKLGFRLLAKRAKDGNEERPAFSLFSEDSDVDIAIVSDALFDNIWKRCFEFWHSSGYAAAKSYWPSGAHFRDYIFRGWMRPDHLPSEGAFTYRSEWFDVFRQLTSDRAAGDYKLTAGLYREPFFLEAYQKIAIDRAKAGAL